MELRQLRREEEAVEEACFLLEPMLRRVVREVAREVAALRRPLQALTLCPPPPGEVVELPLGAAVPRMSVEEEVELVYLLAVLEDLPRMERVVEEAEEIRVSRDRMAVPVVLEFFRRLPPYLEAAELEEPLPEPLGVPAR